MQPNSPSEARNTESAVASALNRIADEMQLLRTAIDEFRSDFQWATQNEKFPSSTSKTKNDAEGDRPFLLPLFNEGELVELQIDGRTVEGEICRLDDATNSATVQLIPSGDLVPVSQDELLRLETATDSPSPIAGKYEQQDGLPKSGTLF